MEGIYKKDNSYKNVKKKSVTHVDYSGERGVLHFYGIIYIFLIFMRKLTPSFFKAKKCMCWQCIVYRKRRSQDLWTIPPQRIRNLRRDKVCIWDLFVFCLSCFCLVLCCVVCVFVCVCFVFVVVVYFERQVFEKRYYMYMTELTIETYLWILVQLSY